jgi:histidine triad (HIT) family protein
VDASCIFCRIIAGEAPCSLVAEAEHAVAFMDIAQLTPGHVLVVSRRHARELTDLAADEVAALFGLVHRVALAIRASSLRCEGVSIWQNNGLAAGQDVFHVHVHIIPRFVGDPIRVSFDRSRPRASRADLDSAAQRIREALL